MSFSGDDSPGPCKVSKVSVSKDEKLDELAKGSGKCEGFLGSMQDRRSAESRKPFDERSRSQFF